MPDTHVANHLRKEIRDKQNEISDHLSYLAPRGARLTLISSLCGAVAALLSGQTAVAITQGTASWIVPLLAALLSVVAAAAAGWHKAEVESRLPRLEKCAAGLESLAVLLDARQLSESAAAKEFRRYIEDCPTIPRRKNLPFESVTGSIDEPHEGQMVRSEFVASGSVHDLGKQARLWLAVEIDDRIWPKEGHIVVRDVDGRWSQPVFEDGTADQFALSLWAANAEADRALRAWLDTSNRTRTFPELRPLPGMRRLARVRGLRRET
jgi:hypothetical protein